MRIAMNKLRVWQLANHVVLDNTRDRLIVWPHHPDQLRRPASRPGALPADNFGRADLARRGRHCANDRSLDLASMSRDTYEVGVVTGVPPIHGQPTCEFVNLFHRVLVTRGHDARLAWDHADRVRVGTRCGSGHKHVA